MEGRCHCGRIGWTFEGTPSDATICNCSVCRRYGVLWAYGHDGEEIGVSGATTGYVWGTRTIGFHFCPVCGCVSHWRGRSAGPDGRVRIAVNLRLVRDPAAVQAIPLLRFDGQDSFEDQPLDGRCVTDVWW